MYKPIQSLLVIHPGLGLALTAELTHTAPKPITPSELFPGCMVGPSHTCRAAWSRQLAQQMLQEQEFFTSAFQLILHRICHYIHQRN